MKDIYIKTVYIMSLNFSTNDAPPLTVIISVDGNFFPPDAKAKYLLFLFYLTVNMLVNSFRSSF